MITSPIPSVPAGLGDALIDAEVRSAQSAPEISASPPRPTSVVAASGQIPRALVPIVIGGIWAVAIGHLRLQQMTDLGLIAAMPPIALLMLALLTVSFAVAITRRPLEPFVVLVHVLVLVIALYGITEFVEPVPRFSSVYRHVGIIDYLIGHRSINPAIDAYFDWPGFFALGALLTKLAGWGSAVSFAAWGPLVYNLLYLPPLLAIFSWATPDRRVRWLALWVFYSANWIGEDYISPQGTAFLLWLTILALLLRWFTPSPGGLPPAASVGATFRRFGRRALSDMEPSPPRRSRVSALLVLLVVLLCYAAIVTGHQLTPVPVIIAVSGLVLLAGCQARGLPVLMILGLAVWIGFMTTDWLSGNIQLLVTSLGSVLANLELASGSRVTGSPGHVVIAELNLLFSATIWILAGVGVFRRLRGGRLDLAMVTIGLTPFLLPLLQPYGGEIILRLFLFSLPAAAFFIACAVFPSPEVGVRWHSCLAIATTGCVALLGFQYTRYGNERFSNFTRSDAAAVTALYRLASRGSKLEAGDDNLPWREQSYVGYRYYSIDELRGWRPDRPRAGVLLADLRRSLSPTGGYVVITRSTEIYASIFEGKPTILPRLVALLRRSPGVRLLYARGGAEIFFVKAA